MIEPNQATIEAYNDEAKTYIDKTPHDYQPHHQSMLNWINTALEGLTSRTVLEVGSATPRDARYMRNKGFVVQTSDASKQFVKSLQDSGENAILFNVLTDPVPGKYDLVIANAVAPHFTKSDLERFLNKINASLSSGGRLAFNLKGGDGEAWVNEKLLKKRFIQYWHPEDVKALLANYDFKIIFFETNAAGDLPNHHWINIVVEKI